MVEGIELTLKSMLDVVRKFGVEGIADTNEQGSKRYFAFATVTIAARIVRPFRV
jgi:hypothetical protein